MVIYVLFFLTVALSLLFEIASSGKYRRPAFVGLWLVFGVSAVLLQVYQTASNDSATKQDRIQENQRAAQTEQRLADIKSSQEDARDNQDKRLNQLDRTVTEMTRAFGDLQYWTERLPYSVRKELQPEFDALDLKQANLEARLVALQQLSAKVRRLVEQYEAWNAFERSTRDERIETEENTAPPLSSDSSDSTAAIEPRRTTPNGPFTSAGSGDSTLVIAGQTPSLPATASSGARALSNVSSASTSDADSLRPQAPIERPFPEGFELPTGGHLRPRSTNPQAPSNLRVLSY